MAVSVLYAKVPSVVAVGSSVEVLFEIKGPTGRMVIDGDKYDLVDIRWLRYKQSSTGSPELVAQGRSYVPKEQDIGCTIKVVVALRNPVPSQITSPTTPLPSSPPMHQSASSGALDRQANATVCETIIESVLPTPPRPAARALVSSRSFYRTISQPGLAVRVVSYNILSPAYATEQQYPYAKPWCLDVSYRRTLVLEHLAWIDADIVCMQEIARAQFLSFFLPEFQKRGYDGVYKQKSTEGAAVTQLDNQLDGCAVFFRTSKFSLVRVQEIEFQAAARKQFSQTEKESLIRFSKQNVGQLVMLAVNQYAANSGQSSTSSSSPVLSSNGFASPVDFTPAWLSPPAKPVVSKAQQQSQASLQQQSLFQQQQQQQQDRAPRRSVDPNFGKGPSQSRFLCVANLHVVSDTKLNDVKLFQVHTLTSMMASFIQECGGSTDSSSSGTKGDTAVVFCGDFNSAPDSCVYEYLTNGALTPERLKEVDTTGALQRMGGGDVLWHDLDLESAYVSAIGHEPSYTNFTENFVGCLDYVFVSVPRVRVSAVLLPPLADELQDETALPSTQQPSDHVPMCADLFL